MQNNAENQKIGTYVGTVLAIIIFQWNASSLFDGPRKEGFDFVRILVAGGTGAIGAVLGRLIVIIFGNKS